MATPRGGFNCADVAGPLSPYAAHVPAMVVIR